MGFSANGFDEGLQEISVNIGTAVGVTVGGISVLITIGENVDVDTNSLGLAVDGELQPTSKTTIVSNET
jgi:hypothetical protein